MVAIGKPDACSLLKLYVETDSTVGNNLMALLNVERLLACVGVCINKLLQSSLVRAAFLMRDNISQNCLCALSCPCLITSVKIIALLKH